MMRKSMRFLLPCLLATLLCTPMAFADVQPGQTIDKSNVQAIKGLVPDFLYNLVADGKMTMKIGKLNLNKKEYFFPRVLQNWESNKGKYGIDDGNNLIEVATKKKYPHVVGIPFPDLDPNDPKFGYKAMYNWRILDMSSGNQIGQSSMVDVDNGKIQRESSQDQLWYRPQAGEPMDEYDWLGAGAYRKPYDMSGLAILDMQSINPEASKNRYVYMPGMRKLRRMSAVLPTSESQMGFSFAEDDITFGGHSYIIPAADYKMAGVKEMLVPFLSENPIQATKDSSSGKYGVVVKKPEEGIILGAASGKTDVADWVPVNVVWVKAPVAQVDTKPTLPAYQFGKMEGWLDLETGRPAYKIDYDKSGKAIKYVLFVNGAYISPEWKAIEYAGIIAKEIDRAHATMVARLAMPGNKCFFDVGDKLNKSTFTKEGFAKFTQ